ncbi:MAG TPA: carboxymuconolactone decarboxylase family protein [Candidatus Eisenbacteria bacterium]|nr:carboxymuconolactone decarboxylase family protein [Candidatus Eisenbacteria bacterium]
MRDAGGSVQALAAPTAALVTLSAAIAVAGSDDVTREAERALATGVPPAALYEATLQSYLFVGFPRAIEALFAVRPVLERAGWSPAPAEPPDPARWRRDGDALCRRVYGRNFERLLETMRGLSPDLADWMILQGYGMTLSRPALGAVDREVAVVAILTTTRMWRQLRSHAIGAVNVGGTRAGVREAIARCEPYAGAETVAEALRVAGFVEEEGDGARR